MSTGKRKAAARKQPSEPDPSSLFEEKDAEESALLPSRGAKRGRKGPTTTPPSSSTTATATAQLLVNETCVRTVLRSEDLLTRSVTRSGLIKSVAMAAALWVQNSVLLASSASDDDEEGRVDWTALHQTVVNLDSTVAREIAPELPETIAIDKSKRKYLAGVKKGGGGEKGNKKQPAAAAPKKAGASVSKKEWKEVAAAAASSLAVENDHEREPSEIIADEEDYD